MFSEIATLLTGVESSSLAWGDYDNDGDVDLLLAGYASSSNFVTKLYGNDGSGAFSESSASLTGVFSCSLAWGDYDSDGDLDIALAGEGAVLSEVYENEGGGLSIFSPT